MGFFLRKKSRLFFSACSSQVPHIYHSLALKHLVRIIYKYPQILWTKNIQEVTLPTEAIMAAVAYREQSYLIQALTVPKAH
jgi:hypothetical protein